MGKDIRYDTNSEKSIKICWISYTHFFYFFEHVFHLFSNFPLCLRWPCPTDEKFHWKFLNHSFILVWLYPAFVKRPNVSKNNGTLFGLAAKMFSFYFSQFFTVAWVSRNWVCAFFTISVVLWRWHSVDFLFLADNGKFDVRKQWFFFSFTLYQHRIIFSWGK